MTEYIVTLNHKEDNRPNLDDITKTFNISADKIDAHHGVVPLDDTAVTIVTDLKTAESIEKQGAKGKITGILISPESTAHPY